MIKYLLIFILTNFAYSQSVGDFGNESIMKSGLDNKIKKQQELSKVDNIPATGFVDNEMYYLGPGDIVFLKSIPAFPEGEILTITPEGILNLPRSYGKLDVKGKTFNEVTKLIAGKLKSDNVSVDLYKAKVCSIEISGDILNAGIFTLPGTYRVSDVFNMSSYLSEQSTNEVTQLKNLNKFKQESRYKDNGSVERNSGYFKERNIKIIRFDGKIFNADIIKSMNHDNKELNPYIMPGDKIIISESTSRFNNFQIRGAVINQATIMFKEGDKLSDLIKVAQGLNFNADLDNVKLYSANNEITEISINENLEVIGNDPVLAPNSILLVGQKDFEKFSTTGVVTVKGEVLKPGAIVIQNGKTKISEIIEMAGGLKETAYLPLARVSSKVKEENSDFWELYRQDAFFQYSDLGVDDTLRMNIDTKIKSPYLAIDVENAVKGGKDNIALYDGDQIYIPKSPNRIYIFGKVYNPGFVEFKEGKSFKWYLEQVGGALPSADAARTRIIRGNNMTWVEPEDHTIIYAGDMIYVPSYPEISEQAQIQKWATYTSIGVSIINVIIFVVANILAYQNNKK